MKLKDQHKSPVDEKAKALEIIKKIQEHGFDAFLVGGCVRDRLLGLEPKDYDVVTSAHPPQLEEIFPNSSGVGKHFGVIIVDGVEIATFRRDGVSSDSRRPDSVEFSNMDDDSCRRDFTINAFYESSTGKILNNHNGLEDLNNKVIRCIGDPDERFHEDFLRMFRAIRFACQLDFIVDEPTLESLIDNAHHATKISSERIGIEVIKALQFNPAKAIYLLQKTGLLQHLPSFRGKYWTPVKNPTLQGILTFAFDEGDLTALRCDANTIKNSRKIKGLEERLGRFNSLPHWAKWRLCAESVFKDLLTYDALKNPNNGMNRILASRFFFYYGKLPKPILNGNDLLALGFKGKPLGDVLTELFDLQLNGDLETKRKNVRILKC